MPFQSDRIINMIKFHSSKQDESYGLVKYAVLKEYNPEHGVCKVGWYNPNKDDYDSLISGWLPIVVPFIGRGDDTTGSSGDPWGLVCPPNIGQPVVVLSQHGDFNNGLVIGGTYSAKSPVPKVDGQYTQDGEFLIMHKTGSYIKLWNDGDITIFTKHDLNLHIGHNGNVHVLGDLNTAVDGQVAITSGKSALLSAKSQIALDAPVVNVSKTLSVGNGATGQFEANGLVITVENGIVTNII